MSSQLFEHTFVVPMFGSLNGHDMVMRARGMGATIPDWLHDEVAYMQPVEAAGYLENRVGVCFIDRYKHGHTLRIGDEGGRVNVQFRSSVQPKCRVVIRNLSRYDAQKMQVDFESSGLWYLDSVSPSTDRSL